MDAYLADGNNAKLGVIIAATVTLLIFNADWRHYIKYWAGPQGSISRRKAGALRTMILLLLVGTLLSLIGELRQHDLSAGALLASLLYAAGILSVFLVFDLFMRWRWRK